MMVVRQGKQHLILCLILKLFLISFHLLSVLSGSKSSIDNKIASEYNCGRLSFITEHHYLIRRESLFVVTNEIVTQHYIIHQENQRRFIQSIPSLRCRHTFFRRRQSELDEDTNDVISGTTIPSVFNRQNNKRSFNSFILLNEAISRATKTMNNKEGVTNVDLTPNENSFSNEWNSNSKYDSTIQSILENIMENVTQYQTEKSNEIDKIQNSSSHLPSKPISESQSSPDDRSQMNNVESMTIHEQVDHVLDSITDRVTKIVSSTDYKRIVTDNDFAQAATEAEQHRDFNNTTYVIEQLLARIMNSQNENNVYSQNEKSSENYANINSSKINDILDFAIERSISTLKVKGSYYEEEQQQHDTKQNSDEFPNSGENSEFSFINLTDDRENYISNKESTTENDTPINYSTTKIITTEDIERSYGKNPTISLIALAQHLWSNVLRPNIDCAIDATAGNGQDSLAIANILFSYNSLTSTGTKFYNKSESQLICVDIQEEACTNTKKLLQEALPSSIIENNIHIVTSSHSPLSPLTRFLTSPQNARSDDDNRSVTKEVSLVVPPIGLIVYNLGILPNTDKITTSYGTSTLTTIASIADACCMVRIGGMISIMTYPRTNHVEDWAVQTFLQCLGLFSSREQSWELYLESVVIPFKDISVKDCSVDDLRQLLKDTLSRVYDLQNVDGKTKNNQRQRPTWRVHEHRKLGFIDPPVLFTAVKLK